MAYTVRPSGLILEPHFDSTSRQRTARKKDCMVSSWYGGTRVTSGVPTYPLSTLQYFSKASNTLRHHARTLCSALGTAGKDWGSQMPQFVHAASLRLGVSAHTAGRCSH